jgi:hypothetical protein
VAILRDRDGVGSMLGLRGLEKLFADIFVTIFSQDEDGFNRSIEEYQQPQ